MVLEHSGCLGKGGSDLRVAKLTQEGKRFSHFPEPNERYVDEPCGPVGCRNSGPDGGVRWVIGHHSRSTGGTWGGTPHTVAGFLAELEDELVRVLGQGDASGRVCMWAKKKNTRLG